MPGSGRSPGRGHGNPLQYSCVENPMDRGAWQAIVHGGSQRVGHDCSDLACTQKLDSKAGKYIKQNGYCTILLSSLHGIKSKLGRNIKKTHKNEPWTS